MKHLYLISVFVLVAQSSQAQTVGIGTNTPHQSAQLEIKSTSKGILLPRLDTAQIKAISQPANGLTVYCTTYKQLAFWEDNHWMLGDGSSMNPVKLGDNFGGGTVFYVDGTGKHGLTIFGNAFDYFMSKLSSFIHGQYISTDMLSYFHSFIGSGRLNTEILYKYEEPDPFYPTTKNLWGVELEGFADWYIPSRIELDLLIKAHLEGTVLDVLALTTGRIWSSEPSSIPGNMGTGGTYTSYWVRCVSVAAGGCGGSNAWTKGLGNSGGASIVLIRQF